MKNLSDYFQQNIMESVAIDDNVMKSLLDALAPYFDRYADNVEKNAKGPHKKYMLTYAKRVRDTWRDELKDKLLTDHDKNDGKTIGHNWSHTSFWMGGWKDLDDVWDWRTDEETFTKSHVDEDKIEFEYGTLMGIEIYNSSMFSFGIVIDKFKPNKVAKDLAKGAAAGGSLGSGLYDKFNTEISKGDKAVGTNKSMGFLMYGTVIAVGNSKVTLQNEHGKSTIEPENLVVILTADGKSIDGNKVQPRKLF